MRVSELARYPVGLCHYNPNQLYIRRLRVTIWFDGVQFTGTMVRDLRTRRRSSKSFKVVLKYQDMIGWCNHQNKIQQRWWHQSYFSCGQLKVFKVQFLLEFNIWFHLSHFGHVSVMANFFMPTLSIKSFVEVTWTTLVVKHGWDSVSIWSGSLIN